jgi:FkbM family methyltransferase
VPNDEEIYVDVGAYDGDSIAKFIECTPSGKYRKIHAFEPNQSSYSKLSLMTQWIPNLFTYKLAVSNTNSILKFNQDGGSMAARLHKEDDIQKPENLVAVNAVKLDDILDDVTFMKIDVEGFESDVLEGATKLIQKCRPTMIVDTYHHANDAIKIYEKVLNIHKYKFIGMRFAHANLHAHSLYFSDTKILT